MVQRHRKVQVVVGHADDVLLLQTNAERGGFWQNVTGSADPGESWPQAAARELLEETGIALPPQQLIDLSLSWNFRDRWGRDVEEHAFLAVIKGERPSVILSDEHQQHQWQSRQRPDWNLLSFESNRQAIQKAILHPGWCP